MQKLPLLLLLIIVCYYWWTIYGSIILNKEIFIKRVDPQDFKLAGDLTINEDYILIRFKWNTKEFSLQQIKEIKAYSLTDWGLSEYEQVDIKFDNNHKIKLDGSLTQHRDLTKSLLLKLHINNPILAWGFLPHLNDKMRKDIIYEKNNIR